MSCCGCLCAFTALQLSVRSYSDILNFTLTETWYSHLEEYIDVTFELVNALYRLLGVNFFENLWVLLLRDVIRDVIVILYFKKDKFPLNLWRVCCYLNNGKKSLLIQYHSNFNHKTKATMTRKSTGVGETLLRNKKITWR